MRAASVSLDQLYQEVASPSINDQLLVTAWRGGTQLTGELEVNAFSLSWDASRAIQGQATVTVADPDGVLVPFGLDAPLACGGSRLKLAYQYGMTKTTVPLGWWRIRKTTPRAQWQWRRRGDHYVWLPGGGTVTVEADEETATIDLDRLPYTERLSGTGSVIGEIQRLLSGTGVGLVADAITDRTIVARIEYDDSRLGAIEGLLQRLGAAHRMTETGDLEIVPETGVPVAWLINPGDDGVYVTSDYSMDDTGLGNAVHARNQFTPEKNDPNDPDEPEPEEITLDASAYHTTGALAYGGAFGRVPGFRSAIATTQQGVQDDANSALATLMQRGDVPMSVTCLTNPALQVHDIVSIAPPSRFGDPPLQGRVTAVSFGSSDGTPAKSMQLTIAVCATAFEHCITLRNTA